MARPNRSAERKTELIPVLARAFADLGYAGATTAALADACGLRENQLYRLWPSKKAMFLATLDHLYELETVWWNRVLGEADPDDPSGGAAAARHILEEEGKHRGETGLHRIIFAGLSETDDQDIRAALGDMYRKFHRFIAAVLKRAAAEGLERGDSGGAAVSPSLAAWSLIALATYANIARELDVFGVPTQRKLMAEVGAAVAGLGGGGR